MSEKGSVICIVGPTASGKTKLSIELAKKIHGEIISADSMQIYRYMDVGTAKPTCEEMQEIKHHMIDLIDPDQNFSVAQYQNQARVIIDDCLQRAVYPIVVGGSGLYINALTYDLDFFEVSGSKNREALEKEYDQYGALYMHEKLKRLDLKAAKRIHPNDKKRIIRRLEILESGKGETHYQFEKPNCMYQYILVGITKNREKLYEDINHRVDEMRHQGLEEEVRKIYDQYGIESTAFQAIGYKEFIPYFEGRASVEEVYNAIKQNTRRFAKRQFTWFKRDPRIQWFVNDDPACFPVLVDDILNVIKNDK